jgi:hypothetical protein
MNAMHAAVLLALTAVAVTAAPQLHVAVDLATATSQRIPADLASFSVEIHCPRLMFYNNRANASAGVRRSYINLLAFLRTTAGTATGPNLRVGGNSADDTFFAPSVAAAQGHVPAGDTYVADPVDIDAFAHMGEMAIGGTVTLDLSLRNATDPANAVAFANATVRRVPRGVIAAFEIGNEPELFRDNGVRPKNDTAWTYAAWERLWAAYAAALWPVIGMPRVQGAVFCCQRWQPDVPAYVRRYTRPPTNFLSSFSQHFYPQGAAHATIEQLLAPASVALYDKYWREVAAARAGGIAFVIGEGNSAFDGGKHGVSDAFAATAWGLDVLLNAAAANISRFNFHGCEDGAYTPIDTRSKRLPNATAAWQTYAWAKPLYYGMWAAADATARDAHVVAHALRWSGAAAAPPNVVVHTTLSLTPPARAVAVVIHKDVAHNATAVGVVLSLGAACAGRAARVRRGFPANASFSARGGISFGGQSFDGSVDGAPVGTPVEETLKLDATGPASLTVHPVSFVVVDVLGCALT